MSSVPDKEFSRPKTIEELRDTAVIACDILYAVSMHLVGDADAWRVAQTAHEQLVEAHAWIKDLACWCPLDQPCHADVLLEIANGVTKP